MIFTRRELNESGTSEEKFEGINIEDHLGYNPDLGLTRSEDLASDPTYSNFFRDPKIMTALTEHLDITDSITRKAICYMNEAEQGSVLTSLTSKLYDIVVSKVDDIDYGDIPLSKGDLTKLPEYERITESVALLTEILKEFKQDTAPVNEIFVSISNITARKDLFTRAFRYNVEMPILMYNNVVLSIISAISYMIATSIEFMKTPNKDSFDIVLDKVAYTKTKNNMLYNNLKKFNKCCERGDFDKAMEHIIQNRIKGIGEAAIGAAIASVAGTVALILTIIPILREMVFFFYYTRMRLSDFFNIQADLLQMNAYRVQNNENIDNFKRERIASKQLKIVDLFRTAANKITFVSRKAEVDAMKEIESNSKKMKLGDLDGELPDSVSALF